jgi:uncharacterized membrane protein YphA (DoxX/SURF4 family)
MQESGKTKARKYFDTEFFSKPTHPVNLAVFRIVFALTLFYHISWPKILFFANLPEELRFSPQGLEWFVPYIKITSELAILVGSFYYFFSFCLVIGFYSRIAALGVALTAFYVLGIESFFGNVSHAHHHIVLFSLVLACSRCGDSLSIDEIIARKKGIDTFQRTPSIDYTVPIRIIWILIAMIYFFPGFWKLTHGGIEWALGDNLKYQFYHKWFGYKWLPIMRIDEYPLLYKMGGIGTIFFEISFVFLLFIPPLRYIPVFMGIFFHAFTFIFMKISFWSLAFCYVVFIDWHSLFIKIGTWLKRDNLQFYSPNQWEEFLDEKSAHGMKRLFVVGVLLIAAQIFVGFTHCRDAWPISCYPTFRSILGPQKKVTDLYFFDKSHNRLYSKNLNFSPSRGGKSMRQLLSRILNIEDFDERNTKLQAFVYLWTSRNIKLKDVTSVEIYRNTFSVMPEHYNEGPLKSKLIGEYAIKQQEL